MDSMRARQKMAEIKKQLVQQDREKAMRALVELFHYTIAPRVPVGPVTSDTPPTIVFENSGEIEAFRMEKALQKNALTWVFCELAADELLQGGENGKISLTVHGIVEYCRE